MITHACPGLNKSLQVATLYLSFLDRENPEPVSSILQVDKEKPAASLPKMTAEGFSETESSLLGHKKNAGLRLLKLRGSSKEDKGQKEPHSETSPPSSGIQEVSSLTETEGKAQKAPGQRVQEEGKLAMGRKGIQQKEAEDTKKPRGQDTESQQRKCRRALGKYPNARKSRDKENLEEAPSRTREQLTT